MELSEILDEMWNLCDTHDIQFEVNNWGVVVKKYFKFGGKMCNFNQAFDFDFFKRADLEDCVLEFERRLEIELGKMERKGNADES